MLMTKEQILLASDIKTQDVQVPEWGGAVRVQAFSGNARNRLMEIIEQTKKDKGDITIPMIKVIACSLALVDEKGDRLFTDAEMEALGKKSCAAIDQVYAVVEKLNALSPAQAEAIEKN